MKSIVITTERVNSMGFKVLSDGGDIADYLKNPILLYDHVRRTSENRKDIILPIGKLNNLRNVNKAWLGDPEFDLGDTFAVSISNKFAKGYLNAASIGIEIIETSEDPKVMEPGQKLPTVTKWRLKEVSITDVPANADAVKLSTGSQTLLCLNGKTTSSELSRFFRGGKTQDAPKDGDRLIEQLSAQWEKRFQDGSLEQIRLSNPTLYEALFQARFHKKLINENLAMSSLETLDSKSQSANHLRADWDRLHRDGSLTEVRINNPKYYDEMFKAKFHDKAFS